MTVPTKRLSANTRKAGGDIPGDPGIWILIFGDMSVFAVLFGAFMYSRSRNSDAFAAAHEHLDVAIGTGNTLLLLTSSMLVALAVERSKPSRVQANGDRVAIRYLFVGALGCGVLFVCFKALEWSLLLRDGAAVGSNEYFSYYFMMTGTHLVHVLIGLVVLARLVSIARRPRYSRRNRRLFETGGLFWHMVDLLWVVLFALFYLVR